MNKVDPNIAILTAKMEELEKLLASAQQEVLSTQSTLKEKSSDALQIQKESDELSTQLMESIEEMDACRVTIKNLEETLLDVNGKSSDSLKQLEQQLADMKCDKEKCCEKMQDMEFELISAQEKNDTLINLEEQLDEMKIEKEILSAKILELEQEVLSAKEKNDTLIQLEQELANIKTEKEICLVKFYELQQEVIIEKEKNGTLSALEHQLNEMKSEKEISSVKIHELEQEVLKLQVNNGTRIELEQQLAEMKSEREIYLAKMQRMEEEMIGVKNENLIELEQQLADLKSEKEISSIKMQELEQEVLSGKEKNESLIDLEQQLAEVKAEKEIVSVKLQELEQEVNVVKQKNDQLMDLEQELADLKCEKEISSVKMQELEFELISVQQRSESLMQLDQADMKCEKEICAVKIHELEKELINEKKKNEDLLEQTKMLQSQSDRLSLELESLINEDKTTNVDFQNQLDTTTRHNSELKEKVKDLENVFDEKETKIKELEDEISAQEQEMTSEIADLKKGLTGLISMEEENVRLKHVEKQHKKCGTKLQDLQEKVTLNEALEMELKSKYDQIHELETTVQEKDSKIEQLKSKMLSNQEESIATETSDEVVKLQKQLDELREVKVSTDDRVFELEEEMSRLNEDYQKKMDELVAQKTREQEAALTAVLENEKLRIKLASQVAEHQKLLDAEAKKYADLVMETDEERLKSIEEMDEIVAKLNSTKCSLDDAKVTTMQRDLRLIDLELEITEMQSVISERDGKINELEKVMESEALSVDVNLQSSQLMEIEKLKCENKQNALNWNEINEKLRDLEVELSAITKELRDTKQNNSVLDAEVTNRDSMLLLNEETIDALRNELEHLKMTLQERTDECAELKTRYRRRSCDGEKKVSVLEAKNTELLQENGAIQAMKLAVENELKKLKVEWQQMVNQQIPQLEQDNERLSSLVNEQSFKYSLLDEKYCQIVSDYEQLSSSTATEAELLQKELKSLNVKINEQVGSLIENEQLSKQYQELKNVHLFKVQQLQEEIEKLQKTINTTRSSPTSSNRIGRTSLDDDLFVKQQLLFEERRNTPKRATVAKVERKNRRQSVHDDNRRLSVWEMHNERECQTDPVDENCACAAMNEKIVKLSRDLRIKECQMQNYEKMSKINPLQLDVEELKKALSREQKTHGDTRRELNETKRLINKMEIKISELQRNQIIAVHKMEQSTQTQEEKKKEEVSIKVMNEIYMWMFEIVIFV